ncbi:hypothetical protein [Rhizobium sp. IBUN]|uniref:hypothetical protein n=1 Tax=Rhizobium sp. IBUN TaxID=1042326 RepID=UPI00046FDE95
MFQESELANRPAEVDFDQLTAFDVLLGGLPPLMTGCFDAVLFFSVNDAITAAASTIIPAVIMIQRGNLLSRFGGSVGGFSCNDVPAAETVCASSSVLVPLNRPFCERWNVTASRNGNQYFIR